MKKVLSMILAIAMIAALVVVPVSAAEENEFWAFDAYELKNSSTVWSFQHATLGKTDFSDLEFFKAGWYYEFYQNWTQGSFPYAYTGDGGKTVTMHAGMIADPVLTFTAPRGGNLQIPSFKVYRTDESGDGVRFQIMKNDIVIFPQDTDWYEPDTPTYEFMTPDIFMTVKKGDKVFLRVNMRETQNFDLFKTMDYRMKYLSEEAYLYGIERQNAIVVNKTPYAEQKIAVNFTDVNGHWGKDYIVPLAEKGIIKGKTATTFEPDSNITRAEFLTLALNVAGIEAVEGETYADVDAGAWFAKTVATAKAKGLIDNNMTADGNFYPDNNITREEMTSVIVKLYEAEKGAAAYGDITVFSDNASFSVWATDYIGKAVQLGVVTGNPDGTFNAVGNATRAEAAVIFSRLLGKL
ncbi:MAG: S-layer homology domain-containing protein [Clostridia bacterium]|nr:S-layer homology domain-containing protein [Clostridia bacterium]